MHISLHKLHKLVVKDDRILCVWKKEHHEFWACSLLALKCSNRRWCFISPRHEFQCQSQHGHKCQLIFNSVGWVQCNLSSDIYCLCVMLNSSVPALRRTHTQTGMPLVCLQLCYHRSRELAGTDPEVWLGSCLDDFAWQIQKQDSVEELNTRY